MIPVADLHCDTVAALTGGVNFKTGHPAVQVDLPRLQAGGVGLQFFAAFVVNAVPAGRAFRSVLEQLDTLDEALAAAGDPVCLTDTAAGVAKANREGRIAAIKAVENGHALEEDIRKVEVLRRRGVRYLTLTHGRHLSWAGSSGEPGGDTRGLSPLGREIIRELEECGILVDVSHAGDATFRDVIRIARRPVIASHSNCRALCSLGRNLTDGQLKAVAQTGGVTGINFFAGLLDEAYCQRMLAGAADLFAEVDRVELACLDRPGDKFQAWQEFSREFLGRMDGMTVPVARVADHILHAVAVAGEDAVAFGADFDGAPQFPEGLADAAGYPHLLEVLAGRGCSPSMIRKLAWENVQRVLAGLN